MVIVQLVERLYVEQYVLCSNQGIHPKKKKVFKLLIDVYNLKSIIKPGSQDSSAVER